MAANLHPVAWDDLRFFLALHRRGSHKAAARELGVNPTTVARRIQALEVALSTKLFSRSPDRALATRSGLLLVEHAERVEAEVFAAERKLQATQADVRGSLRVTAGDGLFNYLLLPALTEFRRTHPALTLELRADMRMLDLSRREADVALRLGRPKQPALLARRLGSMRFALFASDTYLRAHGSPRTLQSLRQHPFIGFDSALDDMPQNRWLNQVLREPRYVLRANTTTAQAVACAEGHGLAMLPTMVGSRIPSLRRVLPRLAEPSRELWGVMHADLRGNAQVGALLDWLGQLLASE